MREKNAWHFCGTQDKCSTAEDNNEMNDKNAGKRNFRRFWLTFSFSVCVSLTSNFIQHKMIRFFTYRKLFLPHQNSMMSLYVLALARLNKFYFSHVRAFEQCTKWNGWGEKKMRITRNAFFKVWIKWSMCATMCWQIHTNIMYIVSGWSSHVKKKKKIQFISFNSGFELMT